MPCSVSACWSCRCVRHSSISLYRGAKAQPSSQAQVQTMYNRWCITFFTRMKLNQTKISSDQICNYRLLLGQYAEVYNTHRTAKKTVSKCLYYIHWGRFEKIYLWKSLSEITVREIIYWLKKQGLKNNRSRLDGHRKFLWKWDIICKWVSELPLFL